jgi:hypothetical protein
MAKDAVGRSHHGGEETMRIGTAGLERRYLRRAMVAAVAVILTACSGNKSTEPDPSLAPFVGDWTAQTMTLTDKANPDVHPDLIALGATFTLNVQASGQYTAILLYASQASTEIGNLEVSGQTVTLHETFPSSSTTAGTFSFQGDDQFTLDGDSEFDFNLDGTMEPALAHIVFVRK